MSSHRLDRIDLVLMQDPDGHPREALDEAAPALSQLRSERVIGGFGAFARRHSAVASVVVGLRTADRCATWSPGGGSRCRRSCGPALTDQGPVAPDRAA